MHQCILTDSRPLSLITIHWQDMSVCFSGSHGSLKRITLFPKPDHVETASIIKNAYINCVRTTPLPIRAGRCWTSESGVSNTTRLTFKFKLVASLDLLPRGKSRWRPSCCAPLYVTNTSLYLSTASNLARALSSAKAVHHLWPLRVVQKPNCSAWSLIILGVVSWRTWTIIIFSDPSLLVLVQIIYEVR